MSKVYHVDVTKELSVHWTEGDLSTIGISHPPGIEPVREVAQAIRRAQERLDVLLLVQARLLPPSPRPPERRPPMAQSDYEEIDVGPPGAEEVVRAPYCLACGQRPQEFHVQCLDDAGVRLLEQPIYRWHGLCADCDDRSKLECMALGLERMADDAYAPGIVMEETLRAAAERLREADRG